MSPYRVGSLSPRSPTPMINSPRASDPHHPRPVISRDAQRSGRSSTTSSNKTVDHSRSHSHTERYAQCSSSSYAYTYAKSETRSDSSDSDLSHEWMPTATSETRSDSSDSDLSHEWKPTASSDEERLLAEERHRVHDIVEEWIPPKETLWFIVVAFLAQSFRGFGPGFSRYLQRTAGFRSLELVSVRNGAAVVLLGEFSISTHSSCGA